MPISVLKPGSVGKALPGIEAEVVSEAGTPVEPGQEVGTLRISNEKQVLREVPVRTAGSVGTGTLRSRAFDALMELLFFWI